jgi:glycosyltransferase involved in cell wall biosynthesis
LFDQGLYFSGLIRRKPSLLQGDDQEDQISVVTVNYNTSALTKLMLLTLVDLLGDYINFIVIADNGSTDGSQHFIEELSKACNKVIATKVPWWQRHHAGGLRHGIEILTKTEEAVFGKARTSYLLIVDSDVVFLRSELIRDLLEVASQNNAGLIGEIQYDVGEPYVHPSCMLLSHKTYQDPRIIPFINGGAPALQLQRSMRHIGSRIVDYPVRSSNYIVHRGRGTIAGIRMFAPMHSYATAEISAHFHGNPNGDKLWSEIEHNYQALLAPENEREAIRYISARFCSGSEV